ncbi:hypothetical protein Ndes2526B_g03977 [Nannochloris sp. 'desiccata']|nr:hypothetical protein KSW81_006046 [Chlorella desiccata (nom. nud.)]
MDRNRRVATAPKDRPQRRGFRGTVENSKTKICMRWQNGECRFGDRCNFAHGDDELRQLPPREDSGSVRSAGHRQGESDVERSANRSQGVVRSGSERPAATSRPANGKEHSAWVASGCPIRGPQGWTQYTAEDGEKYYHNSVSNVTQWEAPAEWKGAI